MAIKNITLMAIGIILALITLKVAIAEGEVIDPSITPIYTITCVDPIAREDGSVLAVGEIATRNFFVSTTKPFSWVPVGSNNNECKQVFNLADVPDGQYYYTTTAVDQQGRESLYASDNPDNEISGELGYTSLVVKRLPDPKSPTGLSGTASAS